MNDITVVIVTKNEELNLPTCLESIKNFAKRIVIVDSFSNDKTKEIALKYKCDFYEHEFINYARQFNWGLDNTSINTKWSMRLDADESLTPKLVDELNLLMNKHCNDLVNGIVIESDLYFLGKIMKHGTVHKRKLMIFKTGIGRIEDIRMDERTILSSGVTVVCKNRYIHKDVKNIDFWIKKMNWYATREMQDYIEYRQGTAKLTDTSFDKKLSAVRKKKFGFYYKMPMFFRTWLLFVYNYFFKLGFLDGKEGYLFNYLYHRWYRYLVDTKIYEQLKNPKPFEKTGDLK